VPRMSYNSVQLMFAAFNQWHRAVEDAKRPNALTVDSIGAIVLAAAASEGFINELAEYIDTYRTIGTDLIPNGEQKDRLYRLATAVLAVEERSGSVDEKYTAAWIALTDRAPDKGRAPFQPHALLHRLRNSLMHLRAAREDAAHDGRKITNALAQQGIALKGQGAGDLPWFDRLETPEVAGWACAAARKMVLAVLELSPPTPGMNFDPLDLWKRVFRDGGGFSPAQPCTASE
jgi:hypothetical protein